MIEELLKNYYKKVAIVTAIIVVMLSVTIYQLYTNYHEKKENLYLSIDKILLTTANDANIYLGENFHDKIKDKNSISKEENLQNTLKLSKFTNKINNIEYVYTMIQKDGDIYFTSSSATEDELKNNEIPQYFEKYDDATDLLKNVLKNHKIVYEESTDKWGTFRTVFIPCRTQNGKEYIVGADVKIDYIKEQLDKYFHDAIETLAVIIIILVLLVYYFIKISQKELDDIKKVNEALEEEVKERTSQLQEAKQEIEEAHKLTKESIEFASLIQNAVVSKEEDLKECFKDSFVHWEPKDTVGGDIWLFNKIREDEYILMFIDCTGHGVPGAFVTMIVKAIEREITLKLIDDPSLDVSPAYILGYFNNTMKKLLGQESKDSKSNAGFDGGVIYYNKKKSILKFSGAETPLFYVNTDGKLEVIKGTRYSVGYKKCAFDYKYKEVTIDVQEGMKFYCTTDGFLDQNGGRKDFPFGKKRFKNIIEENYIKPMKEQKEAFIKTMKEYESIMVSNNDRNDDITVIGFEI